MASSVEREVRPGHPGLATASALFLFATAVGAAFAYGTSGLTDPLLYAVTAVAVAGSLLASRYEGAMLVSADLGCSMFLAAFLGPVPVLVLNLIVEAVSWGGRRYALRKLAWNLGAVTAPLVLIAVAFQSTVGGEETTSAAFLLALGAATLLAVVANFVLVLFLNWVAHGPEERMELPVSLIPSELWTVAFVVAAAGAYAELGTGATAVVVLFVAAFAYMSHLVARARERTKEYANLSWGVLSSLVATLDARDARAARHCAAVAMFSRDIARDVGLSRREQELAHTAGLLHDIGKFALSDRVMDGNGVLTDEDWRGIRRHPEIGATLLKDVGVYGPVDEIVRAHHERIDGRGYPNRLRGDEIPEIARIVAVAEVYDTLTAPDTYRSPMSSFEALTEMRRVAGTQLDGRHVEALAELLAGEGIDYRHADAADFDRELDIQRRMNEAAAR